MKERLAIEDVFRFDAPGTLVRPGPIGRLVRLGMGLLCAWAIWRFGWHSGAGNLGRPGTWFWFLFALLLAPYVVNIGFGVRWGAWPRIVLGVAAAGAAAFAYLWHGSVLGSPLWIAMLGVMLYVYSHLGLSFLLSAVLATPGCEMRAVPHLLARLRGVDATEHYCPGVIDTVDRWERQRGRPAAESEPSEGQRRRDWTAGARGLLLIYGLPYVAITLAGNFAGLDVTTAVWTAAFTAMGFACLWNARRCGRVHCWFVGPWFLLAAVTTVLLRLEIVDLGASGWVTLVNVALFGAVLLFFVTENTWGRYFG